MPCTRGASCMLDGKPCRSGAIECGGGKPECIEIGNASDGASCGLGMVCQDGPAQLQGRRRCVPMNPCHDGTLTCSGGAPAATTRHGKAASLWDGQGVQRRPASVSTASRACPATWPIPARSEESTAPAAPPSASRPARPQPQVLRQQPGLQHRPLHELHRSAACTPTNKCHSGRLSCTSGTPQCMDTGMNVANGTMCGTNQYCSNGTCAACTPNVSCDTGNACKRGTTNCASGTSQCRETGNAANGRGCGNGQVCNNGTCVACTPNIACQPSACKVGTTSCSTGTSRCRETGNAPNGSSCGTGRVCGQRQLPLLATKAPPATQAICANAARSPAAPAPLAAR